MWWYRDTYTEPQDMTFCVIGGGVFIYKIMVSDASPISSTGISYAQPNTSTPACTHYYTLSGIEVNKPVVGGIYLCNGKKIIVN